jgi:hypothetical protein
MRTRRLTSGTSGNQGGAESHVPMVKPTRLTQSTIGILSIIVYLTRAAKLSLAGSCPQNGDAPNSPLFNDVQPWCHRQARFYELTIYR